MNKPKHAGGRPPLYKSDDYIYYNKSIQSYKESTIGGTQPQRGIVKYYGTK